METDIIVYNALEQLQRNTGITAKWHPYGTAAAKLDGKIDFRYNGEPHKVFIEVRKELRNHQLPLLEKLKETHRPLMVVAEYIFPKIKEELRKAEIGYLEANGNVFFKEGNTLLWLDGQKTARKNTGKKGRAFTKTGLRIVFHFLLNPDLINLTYREIAHHTGVGFGNINFTMTDLKEQGFLLPIDKRTLKLVNKKELLTKWMDTYEQRLKPALLIGAFRFLKKEDFLHWKKLPLENRKTWWGGEPGGDLLTNYLNPEELTLYTLEKKNDLMRHYRLIPDENGNVKAYRKFWMNNDAGGKAVPPLLVYTDLMNTGDRRCIETAQKIYNEQLQDQL